MYGIFTYIYHEKSTKCKYINIFHTWMLWVLLARPMATITHDTLGWYGWDEEPNAKETSRTGTARVWCFHHYPPQKTNMTIEYDLKDNGRYIFKWFFFHCHVSFPGGVLSIIFVGSWGDRSWLVKSPDSCVGCHLQKRPKQPHGPKMFFSWRGWWKNCPRNFVFLGWSKRIAHFHYTFSLSLILWMSGNPNIMFLINHKHKAPKHESQDSTGGNIEYK